MARQIEEKGQDRRSQVCTRLDGAAVENFGDHKFEREGVWELRIDYDPGYRVYYSIEDGQMILLLTGGDKKTQSSDVDRTAAYLRDYKARKGDENEH